MPSYGRTTTNIMTKDVKQSAMLTNETYLITNLIVIDIDISKLLDESPKELIRNDVISKLNDNDVHSLKFIRGFAYLSHHQWNDNEVILPSEHSVNLYVRKEIGIM